MIERQRLRQPKGSLEEVFWKQGPNDSNYDDRYNYDHNDDNKNDDIVNVKVILKATYLFIMLVGNWVVLMAQETGPETT